MNEQVARFIDREAAREILTHKVNAADPVWSTIDPAFIRNDAAWRLRWIDCAPEGANHQCAPLQDKRGIPMGGNYNENIGPNAAVRKARAARGRHPISGQPL